MASSTPRPEAFAFDSRVQQAAQVSSFCAFRTHLIIMAATQEAAPGASTTTPSLVERLEAFCILSSLIALMMMRLGVLGYPVPWLSLHNATVVACLVFAMVTLDTCKEASAKVSILSCLLSFLIASNHCCVCSCDSRKPLR